MAEFYRCPKCGAVFNRFLNMSAMVLKRAIDKRPFTFKVVFLMLVFYTIHSIKVDIDIYIGDTDIEIAAEAFHFDRSLCNPIVIKDLLSKIKQKHDASVNSRITTSSENLTKHTSLQVRPSRIFQKPAGVPMPLKNKNNYRSPMQTWKKIRTNFTQPMRSEQEMAYTNQAARTVFVTPNEVSRDNRSQGSHGETGRKFASAFHPHTRHRPTKEEQRRLILKAQAQSLENKELYVNAANFNKTTGIFASTNATKTAMFNTTTTSPTRPTTIGIKRERQLIASIKKERGRMLTSRVGHSMSRPDYMSSPYYVESIHPLHIDLVALVRRKIERGVNFPVNPVNDQKMEYVYKPADCKFKSSPYNFSLLVIVRSDAQHLDMRSMIRSTWGNVSMFPNAQLVFAVGVELHSEADVHEESKRHGDIVQGSFIESSFSTTNKTTMAFTWSNGSCLDADVILMTEEDHLVQIKQILEYVRTLNQMKVKSLFTGFIIKHSEVQRTANSPWSVKWTDFPHKFWPPYLRKGCMLISRGVARQLTEAFPYVKFIHVHDAYLGVVAKKLSLGLQNDVRFFQTADNLLNARNYFVFEGFNSPKLLNESWYKLTHEQT